MSRLLSTLSLVLFIGAGCSNGAYFVASEDADWASTSRNLPDANLDYRVFLIGDTGGPDLDGPDETFVKLRQHLLSQNDRSAIVFLGDNIYCCGLPDSGATGRAKAEQVLDAQLAIFDGYPGQVYYIPGNHDWNDSRPGGLETLQRQARYLSEKSGRPNIMIPEGGFPGPHVVRLAEGISLVAIDTEWWLTDYTKSRGDAGDYEVEEDEDFFLELEDRLKDDLSDDDVIVVGHHPMISNGAHGGHLPSRAHLFPLSLRYDKAYIPFPVVGSMAVLYYRYFGGSRQDIQHPRYKLLRRALTRIFAEHEQLVYAAGHEHSLQYFRVSEGMQHQDYIVSGSGTRPTYVSRGNGASFTSNSEGYAVLDYYDDRSVWLSFWSTQEDADSSVLIYRKQIKEGRIILDDQQRESEITDYPDYRDSVAVVAINEGYRAGAFKSFLLGSHHRDLWTMPVTAPYLDLGREAGGLTPVKRGGGMQTVSLRLHGADGRQYVLRSLDKDPSGTVPVILQGTVATDIVQDQIASIQPYGAFILPIMEAAAGIYHTNPKLVYVPDDPRLGPFRETFAGQLMMFEDRPADDESDSPSYGFTEDVESASTMYRKITEDNDDRVDQEAFARVRLFDMLVSDWDRHRDQWRWASFDDPDGHGTIYRPIPRDRDWAFNKMNGIFPSLASQFDPKFQDFTDSYGYLKGLTINGHEQDRRLLSALSRDDWVAIASDLEHAISDSVIDRAIAAWPDNVRALAGSETRELLRIRRAKLTDIAGEYYSILARVADVVGSDKHERFSLKILPGGDVEVQVDKTTKNGEVRRQIYSRVFHASETKEIRFFGLDGNDHFDIQGGETSIKIRFIGGAGDDIVSNVAKARVVYYDTVLSEESILDGVRVAINEDPLINDYDPLDFKHNGRLPQVFFGHNSDDGVFIGGGLNFIRHGFRKVPYRSAHRVVGNVAARTGAFNLDVRSTFVDVSGNLDFELHSFLSSPATIYNFFGYGNETSLAVDSRRFYESRITQFGLEPTLRYSLEQGLSIAFGPQLLLTRVRDDEGRYIGQTEEVDPEVFGSEYLLGLNLQLHVDNVDNAQVPQRGFRFYNDISGSASASDADNLFVKTSSDLRIYLTPVDDRVTLAVRTGVNHVFGEFPYYRASTLGGGTNLRGYYQERFAGRTAFYQNAELRLQLFDFSTYLATGRFGVLAFADNGRVWYDSDESDLWHQGYGGGAWTNLLQVVTLSSWVGRSTEQTTFSLKFGFHY